jgi:hypothetical protein
MDDTLGVALFIAAVIVFFGSFIVGTQYNIRKGDAVLKWLQKGLPLVGERTTFRWMGSSVMEMKIAKAKDPFRSLETLVVFEPRDVPFLWAFARVRGRRDLMIFRAQLRAAPSFELEVFDPRGWSTGGLERQAQGKKWKPVDLRGASPLRAYYSGSDAVPAAQSLVDAAAHIGGLTRLAIRRNVPNLEVQWLLPNTETRAARDLFLRLRQIGEDAARG